MFGNENANSRYGDLSWNFVELLWSDWLPRWLLIIPPVRAGKRHSRTVAPGVVLYTRFCCCLQLLHAAMDTWLLCDKARSDTWLLQSWHNSSPSLAETTTFLTCKTVKVKLGFVYLWILGARKCLRFKPVKRPEAVRKEYETIAPVFHYTNVCFNNLVG